MSAATDDDGLFRRPGSDYWYCHVPDPIRGPTATRKRSTGCREKPAAKARFKELERLAVDPRYAAARACSVADLLTEYKAKRARMGRAAETIEYIEKKSAILRRVFAEGLDAHDGRGKRPVVLASQVTHEVMEAYVDQRQAERVMNTSILKEMNVLGAAWKIARKAKKVALSWDEIAVEIEDDHKHRTRWITRAELALLTQATRLPPRRLAILAFCIATSCEDQAIWRATREDIEAMLGMVKIHGKKNGRRERETPVVLEDQKVLLAYVLENADGGIGGRLFSSWPNRRNDMAHAALEVGIPRFSPNDLRRTYAKWCRNAGLEPEVVGPAMGHANGRMVEAVYGKMTPEELSAVMTRRVEIFLGGAPAPALPAPPAAPPPAAPRAPAAQAAPPSSAPPAPALRVVQEAGTGPYMGQRGAKTGPNGPTGANVESGAITAEPLGFSGARRRNRTADTGIFNPGPALLTPEESAKNEGEWAVYGPAASTIAPGQKTGLATETGEAEGPPQSPPSVEESLARAIDAAASAGQWGIVAQLAAQLESRRRDQATNVVEITPGRRGMP